MSGELALLRNGKHISIWNMSTEKMAQKSGGISVVKKRICMRA
jgi:hypothetical protein